MYQFTGSFVGSIVDRSADPLTPADDPPAIYGTGSRFELEKRSGDWLWAVTTRHQSDELDLNDLGYISDPDHYAAQVWLQREFDGDDESSLFTDGYLRGLIYKSWIWAPRRFADPADPDSELWSYDRGHDLNLRMYVDGNGQFRSRWGYYFGLEYHPNCTSQYETRRLPDSRERGPLMSLPDYYSGWVGLYTDGRKPLSFELYCGQAGDEVGSHSREIQLDCNWVQTSNITHSLAVSYSWGHDDAQWIRNEANPGGGIGGTSFTFGELDQKTWDVTLRSSFLFSRDHSLELYLQPFLTVGDYTNLRELARPDSYDLVPYAGYDVTQEDFSYAAVNLNLVYRWEYRPGSTLFLVWTHARQNYDQRSFHGGNGRRCVRQLAQHRRAAGQRGGQHVPGESELLVLVVRAVLGHGGRGRRWCIGDHQRQSALEVEQRLPA